MRVPLLRPGLRCRRRTVPLRPACCRCRTMRVAPRPDRWKTTVALRPDRWETTIALRPERWKTTVAVRPDRCWVSSVALLPPGCSRCRRTSTAELDDEETAPHTCLAASAAAASHSPVTSHCSETRSLSSEDFNETVHTGVRRVAN